MEKKLKEIALHITESCTHNCPMCYATEEGTIREHGNLENLKKIVKNAVINGVETINLVGGDPCDYPYMVNLLEYIKGVSDYFKKEIKVSILSNTHVYRKDGKEVPIETIVPLVYSLESTIHGPGSKTHDAFCRIPNAYENVIGNLKKYDELRDKENQSLGIIVNMMPETANFTKDIIDEVSKRINYEYVLIQRIAPTGRAEGKTCYAINNKQLDMIMDAINKASNQYPNVEFNFVDVVPYCAVKEENRKFLPKGGCNWGEEIVAVKLNGDITRCAMSSNVIGNFLDLDTPRKFNEFWNNNKELVASRNRVHLTSKCFACKDYLLCRGGCFMSGINNGIAIGDPYKFGYNMPIKMVDSLADELDKGKSLG